MEREDIRLKKEEKVFFDNFSDCYLQIDEVLLSELEKQEAANDLLYYHPLSSFKANLVDIYQGKLVLELCCGTGWRADLIAEHGNTTVGIDISPKMLKIATKAWNKQKNVSFVIADAENLPFRENTFDVVYEVYALHHLPNPKQSIVEMYRVLKQEGDGIIWLEPADFWFKFRPLISFPVIRNIFEKSFIADCTAEEHRSPVEAERPLGFSHKKLHKFFIDAGFSEVNVRGVEYLLGFWSVLWRSPPRSLRKFILKIDLCLSRIPFIQKFSYNLRATAKKRV